MKGPEQQPLEVPGGWFITGHPTVPWSSTANVGLTHTGHRVHVIAEWRKSTPYSLCGQVLVAVGQWWAEDSPAVCHNCERLMRLRCGNNE